jgi:hypothetical protein
MIINQYISHFRHLLVLLILLLPLIAVSQSGDYYVYKPNDTMPSSYNMSAGKLCESVYASIPDYLKKDINSQAAYFYAGQTAYTSCNQVNSGYVYHDWPAFEKYLNQILAEIIPEEYKKDTLVHVYLVRDGNFNAVATGSGQLFLNIGVFNDITDEATLAAIFAHELSHYYLRHSLKYYIAYKKGKFDLGLLGESDKLANSFSITDELQADSMAMRIMAKSKYNAKALLNAFELMEKLENNLVSRDPEIFKIKETDHPLAGVRYSALLDYYKKYKNDTCPYFLVSKESFNRFRTEAGQQILQCLMEGLDFDDCIEKAFRLHLNNPDNIVYIQYILESVRRLCYLDPALWDKQFITDRYYDTVRVEGKLKKRKMTDNIFTKFNDNILPLSQPEKDSLKGMFYWSGDLKFKTNDQAFEFYCKLSEALGDHEYILSNALSFAKDTAQMNKYLRKYLCYQDIKHRAYAFELLKGPLMPFEGARKLMILNSFNAEARLGQEDMPMQSFGCDTSKELSCIVDSLAARTGGRNALYLPSLKAYHMRDYLKLQDLQNFTFRWIWTENRKISIFILNPQYWELFRRFFAKEIEFVNCSYFEDRGGKKSMDDYTNIMNEKFGNMLSQTQIRRYLSTVITSSRLSSKVAPRIMYYSLEDKLEYNDTGYDAIMLNLQKQIDEKEKYQNVMDGKYNK